jgi:hypothetical protein
LAVEGALDNTCFEAMGKACADHDVHFTISRWIAAMLSNRMVQAEIRGVSSTMMVRRGCPQGSVLSPLLWNWLFIPCWFVCTMRAYGLEDLRTILQLLLMEIF